MLLVFPTFVHYNLRICTYRLNSSFTFWNITEPNFCFIASLYFDCWTIYFLKSTSNNIWFWIHTLKVDTNKTTTENFTILNHYSTISLRYNVSGSLHKIWKSAVWNLSVSIYWKNSTCMVSFISNKITTDKIIRSLRKSYNCRKFLF